MPHSDNLTQDETGVEGQSLAVLAESLYVANLLILPFAAFFLLVIIFLKKHDKASALAKSHLEQTLSASIAIAFMFTAAAGVVMLLKMWGLEDVAVWMLVVILFTIIHASMVLFGVFGLAKAMAGKCWRYPVFGRELPHGCHR